VRDQLCRGLAIRVATDGGKTWDLAFRLKGGKVKRPSLGNFDDVDLEQARNRANALTSAARQGRDLQAHGEFTVDGLVTRYVGGEAKGLRTVQNIERTLRRVLAPIASKDAASAKRRDFAAIFDDIAFVQGHERAAARARQMTRSMYRWAIERGHVDHDPTQGTPRYTQGTPRERVLSPDEIKTFWHWLPTVGFAPSIVDIVRLEICIGARSGEICGMRRKEFVEGDDGVWLWKLPAKRAKNKKERVTPILGLAREILAPRLDETDADKLLFLSSTGIEIDSALLAQHLRHRWNRFPIAHSVTHDLRRTLATEMAKMGISLETISLTVGHVADERATRTLIKHYLFDEMIGRKTNALRAWDERLRQILAGAPLTGSNVTSLFPVDDVRLQSS
jgi:integrase